MNDKHAVYVVVMLIDKLDFYFDVDNVNQCLAYEVSCLNLYCCLDGYKRLDRLNTKNRWVDRVKINRRTTLVALTPNILVKIMLIYKLL